MGKITDAIMSLFNSDKVIITDSGQKVVGLEPILEEVKGLDVIDVDTGNADVDTIDTNVTENTDTTELPQYANYDSYVELNAIVSALETRLAKLESLIDVADNLAGEKTEVTELW